MAKIVKTISLILACLFGYTAVGTGTFYWHESRWPGANVHTDTGISDGSKIVAIAWPIGLTISLAVVMTEKVIATLSEKNDVTL